MKITISTTPEQDATITKLNLQSNPDGQTPDDVFAVSAFSDFLDSLGTDQKQADVSAQFIVLQNAGGKLADQDIATLKAIASKYANAQAQTTVTVTP